MIDTPFFQLIGPYIVFQSEIHSVLAGVISIIIFGYNNAGGVFAVLMTMISLSQILSNLVTDRALKINLDSQYNSQVDESRICMFYLINSVLNSAMFGLVTLKITYDKNILGRETSRLLFCGREQSDSSQKGHTMT